MTEPTIDRPGRNDPCHCGSGKKYKRCCLAKDQEAERETRAKLAEETAKEAATPSDEDQSKSDAAEPQQPKRPTEQPWKRASQSNRAVQKFQMPRKGGGG